MRIQGEHMQKVTECLIVSERSYCVFTPQGFVTNCFSIFIVDEVKNFAANNHPQVGVLVTYWDPCKKGGVHILKISEVLKQQKLSAVSSSTRIVEARDKSFVLDLKLLFSIMNCFSRRFPPKFFTVKLVCFIGFPRLSYLLLFNFSLCMILMFVCFNKVFSK